MSALLPHARATKILADSFAEESGKTRDRDVGAILAAVSLALNGAHDLMREEIVADAQREAGVAPAKIP